MLGFFHRGVSGSDLIEMLKSWPQNFKQGSSGLAVSNLPFYAPYCVPYTSVCYSQNTQRVPLRIPEWF